MIINLNDLTVVSITCNNDGIYRTIDSVKPLLNAGCKMIIQNGGSPMEFQHEYIYIRNEKDKGVYDAMNKGISIVKTNFFILLHAGDILIANASEIYNIIAEMERLNKDMSLNSQYIGSRLHSSHNWRPWMLNLGVQPPHLPVIYKTITYKEKKYTLEIPIIADFDFFLNKVNWKNVIWHNKLLVKMETGGATSGGLRSFLFVSKCFIKSYGLRGCIMALTRIPFKLIQAIY